MLVSAILREIRDNYGLKINTSPSFEQGMVTPANQNSNGRIILVGASHMTRTAKYVRDPVSLAYPCFRPDIEKVKLTEKDLKKKRSRT